MSLIVVSVFLCVIMFLSMLLVGLCKGYSMEILLLGEHKGKKSFTFVILSFILYTVTVRLLKFYLVSTWHVIFLSTTCFVMAYQLLYFCFEENFFDSLDIKVSRTSMFRYLVQLFLFLEATMFMYPVACSVIVAGWLNLYHCVFGLTLFEIFILQVFFTCFIKIRYIICVPAVEYECQINYSDLIKPYRIPCSGRKGFFTRSRRHAYPFFSSSRAQRENWHSLVQTRGIISVLHSVLKASPNLVSLAFRVKAQRFIAAVGGLAGIGTGFWASDAVLKELWASKRTRHDKLSLSRDRLVESLKDNKASLTLEERQAWFDVLSNCKNLLKKADDSIEANDAFFVRFFSLLVQSQTHKMLQDVKDELHELEKAKELAEHLAAIKIQHGWRAYWLYKDNNMPDRPYLGPKPLDDNSSSEISSKIASKLIEVIKDAYV